LTIGACLTSLCGSIIDITKNAFGALVVFWSNAFKTRKMTFLIKEFGASKVRNFFDMCIWTSSNTELGPVKFILVIPWTKSTIYTTINTL